MNRNVFRKNRDAPFALEVVVIQHLAAEVLSLAEEISSQHHLVYQCGLAMVYMGNNRDVPNILHTYIH